MSKNKSFSTETSERYSRALFEVAQESSELEKIENDIKNFASILINSLEIKNFIHNPTQSKDNQNNVLNLLACLLYTSPSPRDQLTSRMPSSA